jgi:hypothetical protein
MTVCGLAEQMLHYQGDSTGNIMLLFVSPVSNSRLLYSNTPFRSGNLREWFLPRM